MGEATKAGLGKEISADAQGLLELVEAIERLKEEGPALSGKRCAEIAAEALEKAARIRAEAMPIPLQDISGLEAGETIGQPANVLYTMTIMQDGDGKQWISDRVQRSDQFAWLHGRVLDAAQGLAEQASGAGGLN